MALHSPHELAFSFMFVAALVIMMGATTFVNCATASLVTPPPTQLQLALSNQTMADFNNENNNKFIAPCRNPPAIKSRETRRWSVHARRAGNVLDTSTTSSDSNSRRALNGTLYGTAPVITRVPDGGCVTSDNLACEICCNGVCCERVEKTYQRHFQSSSSTSNSPTIQMWVPLRFAVILSPYSTIPTITQDEMTRQLHMLNSVFTPHVGMFFYLESFETYKSSDSIALAQNCNTDPCYTSEGCYFYTKILPAVTHNPLEVINIVVCDLPYLGEAQWAWATEEDDVRQYIQLGFSAVPGRDSISQGKTLIHEMGHYMGLLHTFERTSQCDADGDYVDDTPSSSRAASRSASCATVVDSCTTVEGIDPTNNYMNYAGDSCMTEFTPGQIDRMLRSVSKYRPKLQERYLVEGSCPSTATNLTQCSCTDSSKRPEDHCGGPGSVNGFVRYSVSGSGNAPVLASVLVILAMISVLLM